MTVLYFIHLIQEREKLKEEKKKYAERLKLWSKPREDMECDDLKVRVPLCPSICTSSWVCGKATNKLISLFLYLIVGFF